MYSNELSKYDARSFHQNISSLLYLVGSVSWFLNIIIQIYSPGSLHPGAYYFIINLGSSFIPVALDYFSFIWFVPT